MMCVVINSDSFLKRTNQFVVCSRKFNVAFLIFILSILLFQNTFSRKPTVLRKVLRAITTSINSGKSEDIKTRVLPHLRSNPRLAQMFKSLFPDERPPDRYVEGNFRNLSVLC